MLLTDAIWTYQYTIVSSPNNIFIKSSQFLNFLTNESSGCIYLDSFSDIEVLNTVFKNITCLSNYSIGNTNGAAIYSTISSCSANLQKNCFSDCLATHGHSYGLFGSSIINFNNSLVKSPRVIGYHPSYIANYEEGKVSEINKTSSSQEQLYLNTINRTSMSYCYITNCTQSNRYPYGIFLYSSKESLSCKNIIFVNITGMKYLIRASDGDTFETIYVGNIENSILSNEKIKINNLFYHNFDVDCCQGKANVIKQSLVESILFPKKHYETLCFPLNVSLICSSSERLFLKVLSISLLNKF